MTSPPPIATFAHRHRRHLALAALFAAAVVLAVSFVANVHGANRHALEQRGMSYVRDARALGNPKGRPSLQEVQDMLDASAKEAPLEKEGGNKNSLSEAQKFVDEYGSGSFDSIADAPAAPVPVAASEPSLQQQDLPINVGNSMAMAPPLPGDVQPAYTSLSAHWMPFQAKSGHNAALASKKSKKPGKGDSASKKSKKSGKGDKAADSPADDGSSAPSADVSSSASSQSGSSKCFNVKNLKKFLPPGFGSVLKSAKKGSNPLDKFLTKAMLPTFGELQVPSPVSTSQPNRSNVAAGCREVRSIHSQSAQSRRPLPQDRFVGLGDHRQVHDEPREHLRQVPVQPQHARSICRAQSWAHGQLRVWSALEAG